MFKFRFLFFFLFLLSSMNTLQAQQVDKTSFIIMTSNGYMSSELRIRGTGHINTFLYCPNKLWGYGGEFGISQGRSYYESINRMLNFSLAPCIYSFILNNNKHQVYLGTSIGFGITDIKDYYRNHRGFRINFGSSAGYNYKFKKHWMIGARLYYNYDLFDVTSEDNIHSSIMGLVSVGFRF